VAWKDFASHPVRGVGTHNYEATSYRLRERTAGFSRQPHMLLEVLAERGVVGLVLFVGFLTAGAAGGLWKRRTVLSAEGKGRTTGVTHRHLAPNVMGRNNMVQGISCSA
jgi:O-antigen ligase